eukprot:TRINITY_DN3846_c0_g2_i1.p1 TRINITY_DN3846_c0_g2~~TRINITY_DN3846_c0_g2_i1.p1  ORF type:complete len:119 (-),score=10.71 TRINITY_DN3846_c0_g2_i1:451-807(-)
MAAALVDIGTPENIKCGRVGRGSEKGSAARRGRGQHNSGWYWNLFCFLLFGCSWWTLLEAAHSAGFIFSKRASFREFDCFCQLETGLQMVEPKTARTCLLDAVFVWNADRPGALPVCV